MGKLFDGKLVFTQIPLLLKYLPVTMELAVTAMIASLILGLLLALVKIKKVPVLKQLVSIYISVIRGTPILVQLYVTYFGIPMLLKYINFKCGTNYNVNGVAPIVYAFVVYPSFAAFLIVSRTSPTSSGSSADVGSSRSKSFGSIASALAIATLCC